jgi:prepilin-type N-terminal cleavage/methylation domain-containing protein
MFIKKNGFSLIEILIALAISSLVLVAVLKLEVLSTRSAEKVSEDFYCLDIAVSKMENISGKNIPGIISENIGDYKVISFREETGFLIKKEKIRKLIVKVENSKGEKIIELSNYIFR